MPKIRKFQPTTLPNYMRVVQDTQRRAGHALWFRGSGNVEHQLTPSIYRHPTIKKPQEYQALERQLITRFRQRSLPYHARDLSDDWEALFFMQHYGVPTRLLDWTENPLVGLYFALMAGTAKRFRTRGRGKAAVVWILDPVRWNEEALRHLSYKGGALTPGDDGLRGYAPLDASGILGEPPVCVYGAHNSPRIVAQQGVFTIFGSGRDSMQSLVQGGAFPTRALQAIVVPATRIERMKTALLNQGVTESAVFPDLEGLARETKRHFGFK